VFVIRSAFYQGNPLIIRGPGAGREVTAAAVQSDLVHICKDLLQE
jgi:aspartokinase/homoserine dehydrogenase 2